MALMQFRMLFAANIRLHTTARSRLVKQQ